MKLTEHLLNQLADECLEVAHRCLKAQAFGIDEVQANGPSEAKTGEAALPNHARIRQEFSDLIGVHELLVEFGVIRPPSRSDVNAKKIKIAKYLRHKLGIGTIKNSNKLQQLLKHCASFDLRHCPACAGDLRSEYAPSSDYEHRRCERCKADFYIVDEQLRGNNFAGKDALAVKWDAKHEEEEK